MQNVANQVMNNAAQMQTVPAQTVPAYPCAPAVQYMPYSQCVPAVQSAPVYQPPVQQNGAYIPITMPAPQNGTLGGIPGGTQNGTPNQSSGVNIIIYNPSVNPAANTVANSNNTYSTPAVAYPYAANTAGAGASAGASALSGGNKANPYNASMAYPANYYTQKPQQASSDEVAKSYLANTSIKETVKDAPEAKKEEETHKEKIVQLTDDYIKTLENYLNNPNVKVREMGIKEVMDRFKEHKSRYSDIALTNLLNKALQDKAKSVRFIALATLDAEFARGDNFTVDILNKMQSSSAVYGEDALMAAEILLKMSRRQVEVTVPGPKPDDKKKG